MRRDLFVIAALALVLRMFAAWAIPLGVGSPDPNCAPDEAAHFAVVRELAAGRAPTWPEFPSIFAVFPPSEYAVQAGMLSLARLGADRTWLYRAAHFGASFQGYVLARLGSVLLGVLTVLCLARAAWVLTGSRLACMFAGLAAAVYPQLVVHDLDSS